MIDLTKLIHSSNEETVYDILTLYIRHYIGAEEILEVEDNSSASGAINYVRRKFPGLISTSYAVDTLKSKLKKECEAVLKPKRCATGWRIQPDRLILACNLFILGCRKLNVNGGNCTGMHVHMENKRVLLLPLGMNMFSMGAATKVQEKCGQSVSFMEETAV